MHDYYDIRGCFVIKPQAMFIWKQVQKYFTEKIELSGVQECYFPSLITKSSFEKEKMHLKNFKHELAWITKCGDTELENPVAVRPTSETIMYPSFSKWIRSHRDLPLRLNQWCNVLRWETKSTLPFIRGREFLWQEGHSAFITREEAEKEVLEILNLYESIYEQILAVPVIAGRKSENEKFGGADYTLSLEAFIPETGKGVQAATSHFLGNNFSKIFDIRVDCEIPEDSEGINSRYVFQTSWGFTTRSIGIAVMIHSDDKGLVLPPKAAMYQAVVVPCGVKATTTEEQKKVLDKYTEEVYNLIKESGVRVYLDNRTNITPGYKFNHWELQGVPMRIEVGFKDIESSKVTIVRRIDNQKELVLKSELRKYMLDKINEIHAKMYQKAKETFDSRISYVKDSKSFIEIVNCKKIAKADWCGEVACEEHINDASLEKNADGGVLQTGAKSLCIIQQPLKSNTCFFCGSLAKCVAIFGRTY